jgi:hypothetical protein
VVVAVAVLAAVAAGGARLYELASDARRSLPAPLRAYARGEGRTYAAEFFTVRLPGAPRRATVDVPVGGRVVTLEGAYSVVGTALVGVVSGTLDDRAAAYWETIASVTRGQLGADGVAAGEKVSVRETSWHGTRVYDLRMRTRSGAEVAERVARFGKRVVVMLAIAPRRADAALSTLTESFSLA